MTSRYSDRYSPRVDYSYLEAPEFLGRTAVSADDSLRIPVSARTTKNPTVGRRQLEALRDRISPRDHQILNLLRRYRLSTTDQIQRQLFVDHRTQDSARRIARRCLRRLAEHGLLEGLGQRIGGIKAGSSSIVWTLTPAGHRMVGTAVRKVRYEPSITHIRHLLAIAELATALIEHSRTHSYELEIETEPTCWRNFDDQRQPLKPDLYTRTADRAIELFWFIEIDRGTESSTVIERKLATYTSYWHTGIEQQRNQIFPKTLWIAPDTKRANFITNTIHQAASRGTAEANLFAVTTNHDAVDQLIDLDPTRETT